MLAFTAPLEPRTQGIDARLLLGPSRGRRIYVAESGTEVAGVAVVYRRYVDRWGAYTLLLDESAAEPLARIVDRSPAREVAGAEGDVAPLQQYMARARKLDVLVWTAAEGGLLVGPQFSDVDPRSRLATRADVDGLAELYAELPFIDAPTMFQLRRMLRRSIDQGLPIPILEVDGEIVAAARMESRGCRYARWTDVVVHPQHRGRGYARALAGCTEEARRRSGLGTIGEAGPKIDIDRARATLAASGSKVDWSRRLEVLQLRTQQRFRGQGRLLRALFALGGPRRVRSQAEA